MTQLINETAEILALHTVLSSHIPEVKNTLFARLDAELFAFEPCCLIYSRIRDLLSKQNIVGAIPGKEVFLHDQVLTPEAKAILHQNIQPLSAMTDVDHLLLQLDDTRKTRNIFGLAKGVQIQLQKSPPDIGISTSLIESTLLSLRGHEDVSTQLWHSGSSSNSDSIVEDLLNPEIGTCLPSHFKNYDDIAGGFRRGNLIIVASHYKGGKSTVKLNMLKNMYQLGNLNVCDITLEMDQFEEMERLLSTLSQVGIDRFRTKDFSPQDKDRIRTAYDNFKEHGVDNDCRFTMWPASHLTIQQMELLLLPMGYDVIAVDYINLLTSMEGPGAKLDPATLSSFYVSLKHMAKRLNCVVIALTQMDEATGDIRYSKSAKEHGNAVWAWHYKAAEQETHVLTVNQLAARGHEPFSFKLYEDFAHATVTDHTTEFAQDF